VPLAATLEHSITPLSILLLASNFGHLTSMTTEMVIPESWTSGQIVRGEKVNYFHG